MPAQPLHSHVIAEVRFDPKKRSLRCTCGWQIKRARSLDVQAEEFAYHRRTAIPEDQTVIRARRQAARFFMPPLR